MVLAGWNGLASAHLLLAPVNTHDLDLLALSAVQHLQFAHRGVHVAIATADHLLSLPDAIGRAVLDLVRGSGRASSGTFLGHTERDWDFEDVLTAVGRSHLTGTGV